MEGNSNGANSFAPRDFRKENRVLLRTNKKTTSFGWLFLQIRRKYGKWKWGDIHFVFELRASTLRACERITRSSETTLRSPLLVLVAATLAFHGSSETCSGTYDAVHTPYLLRKFPLMSTGYM